MKRFILLLLAFISFSIIINAQIYSIREKVDKFDDIVFSNQEKTIITTDFTLRSDSIITFEVKGNSPISYYIYSAPILIGTRFDEVELVGGLYGCEEQYIGYSDFLDDAIDYIGCETSEDSLELLSSWTKHKLEVISTPVIIVHRTISVYSLKRSYHDDEFPYKTDLWWIKYNDGSRMIFRK